jgi:hypothetical protein
MANDNRNRDNARNSGRGESNRGESMKNTGNPGSEEMRRTPGSSESESETSRNQGRDVERESEFGGSPDSGRNTSRRGSNPTSSEEGNDEIEKPGEE